MNIYEKLQHIQSNLKCNKSQYNPFGKYNYRNCEDILESAKPLLNDIKAMIIISDDLVSLDGRFYVRAVARFVDVEKPEVSIENTAYAREDESLKGMTASQITGATSSYARKYALNGLLCIDDTKDADSMDNSNKGNQKATGDTQKQSADCKCEQCGTTFTAFEWQGKKYTAKDAYEIAIKKSGNGKALCSKCRKSKVE